MTLTLTVIVDDVTHSMYKVSLSQGKTTSLIELSLILSIFAPPPFHQSRRSLKKKKKKKQQLLTKLCNTHTHPNIYHCTLITKKTAKIR